MRTLTDSAPIVAADSETDGVHAGRQPWEVAFIRREPDGSERRTQFFVDIDLSTADPFGLKVGGFYERHPLGRWIAGDPMYRNSNRPVPGSLSFKSRREAAGTVARWTHGAHVVGAVPSFDTFTFEPLLRNAGLTPSWHYHVVDVEALAVGWLNGRADLNRAYDIGGGSADPRLPIHPPYKSDDLSHMLGIDPNQYARHEALADAEWALAIYDVCVPARAPELVGARA